MICTWLPVGIFSNSSFIYEKPGINRDKQAKENKTQHFWLGVLFTLAIKLQVGLVSYTSEDTALKYFVPNFPEPS